MVNPKEKKVVVKKVSPYPFSATLTGEGNPLQAKVQKVTTRGVFVEVGNQLLKLNQTFQISFRLPVFDVAVYTPCRVVKFLDAVLPPTEEQVKALQPGEKLKPNIQHLAEMHFLDISESHREGIKKFCLRINQNEV